MGYQSVHFRRYINFEFWRENVFGRVICRYFTSNGCRGNPKKAVKKLYIPLMLSMMIISLYNSIDSFWVAGLGADQLAAVGFVIPLEFLIISIRTNLGAGTTSVVSKYICAKDDEMANNASTHSIILSLIVSVIVTLVFTVFMKNC